MLFAFLNPNRKRLILMQTEKRRSFIINFTYFLILAGISFVLLKYVLPLLTPFVLGFCFAYLLRRPVCFLHRKLGVKGKIPAIISVVVFYAVIGALLALLGVRGFSGVKTLILGLPTLYDIYMEPVLMDMFIGVEQFALQLDESAFDLIREWDAQLIQSIGEMITSLSAGAIGAISGMAASLPGFFIKLLLMVISTFFIAADYERLTGFCMDQLSGKAKSIFLEIKKYLIGTLFVCIRSYALIMLITFVELSLGLTILGLDHAILIAALIAVFDILPVLGTGGIMIPWTVVAALSGRYSLALGLLVIYLVITVIRNILEPKIVGGQLGLHPVVTLASMFAGVQLLGVVGLFGFPIGLSLLRYLNDDGVIHIFKTAENTNEHLNNECH